MRKFCMLNALPGLLLPLQSIQAENPSQVKKPNIMLILADDMGFSDLGFMGSGINTPNLDKLAKKGMVFSQFYNTGRSCPTRASLLTGLYAHQTGLGWMTSANLGQPGYTGDMNNHAVTIAQVLKQADYSCYMTGKWHVTYDKYMKPEGPKHNWPIQRGFDRFFGHLTGGGSYYSTSTLTNDNEQLEPGEDFYLTTAITDSTVSIINQHFQEKKDHPFFFYLAYYAPHRPLQALQKDIDKYRGKFMNGWDEQRKIRYEKLRKIGMIDETCLLTERDPAIPAWESLSEDEKQLWDARMAVYAAQIDCMDQGIGEVLKVLEDNNELDNTLILFLSDNGGNAESQGNKTLSTEELLLLGNETPAQSYRVNWANVSNTPFREYKHMVHEGGISTPLIVYWPAKMKKTGLITKQVGHVIDLMPTLVEVADVNYPKTYKGHEIYPLTGKSLIPTITKGDTFSRKPIFFEHEANRAVIAGDWKLVSESTKKPPFTGEWELYNLKDDRSETNNLIKRYPEKACEMKILWDKWANENNVYPLDNSGWEGKRAKDMGSPL